MRLMLMMLMENGSVYTFLIRDCIGCLLMMSMISQVEELRWA